MLSKDHGRSEHEEWQVLYTTELCPKAFQLRVKRAHIIVHDAGVSLNEENNRIIGKYLTDSRFIEMQDETFACLYDTLKEQLAINPSQHCAINITGGKKSMSASAGIFARDFFCDLIYIDYKKYDPSTRRPEPGSEFLNLVYSPQRDLPELFHK